MLRRECSNDVAHGMHSGVPSRAYFSLIRIERVDLEVVSAPIT